LPFLFPGGIISHSKDGLRITVERPGMLESTGKFFCGGCQHAMTWKQEFAGRRIKCRHCGHAMAIPALPARSKPQPQEDDLYALSELASDARSAAVNLPRTIVEAAADTPVPAKKPSRSGIPLTYQSGPTTRDTQRAAANSQIDPNRDLYVPVALLIVGTLLYIGYYAIHYNLGGIAVISTSIGLTVMTLLETAVLFAFALAIAGPLGVSFGGVGTALLKLAAIAVFCDGMTTWADGLFSKYAGNLAGGGLLSFGIIGFPIAIGAYWTLLIYLFSMDPGDSWMVVVILAVFYRILRVVLLLLLLRFILSFGGIAGSAIGLPSLGGAQVSNPIIDEVDNAKAQNVLHEARKYAADNGRGAESPSINAWYAAGATNVWFQTDRDINGHGPAFRIVVELPDDKISRAKCYDVARTYCNNNGESFIAQGLQDKGDPYLLMPLP
jgi:hypothetical protein